MRGIWGSSGLAIYRSLCYGTKRKQKPLNHPLTRVLLAYTRVFHIKYTSRDYAVAPTSFWKIIKILQFSSHFSQKYFSWCFRTSVLYKQGVVLQNWAMQQQKYCHMVKKSHSRIKIPGYTNSVGGLHFPFNLFLLIISSLLVTYRIASPHNT